MALDVFAANKRIHIVHSSHGRKDCMATATTILDAVQNSYKHTHTSAVPACIKNYWTYTLASRLLHVCGFMSGDGTRLFLAIYN